MTITLLRLRLVFRFTSPGQSTTVSVSVKNDIFKEKPETFYLRATGPAGLKAFGKATIGGGGTCRWGTQTREAGSTRSHATRVSAF